MPPDSAAIISSICRTTNTIATPLQHLGAHFSQTPPRQAQCPHLRSKCQHTFQRRSRTLAFLRRDPDIFEVDEVESSASRRQTRMNDGSVFGQFADDWV